jgi:hypothetical protein
MEYNIPADVNEDDIPDDCGCAVNPSGSVESPTQGISWEVPVAVGILGLISAVLVMRK